MISEEHSVKSFLKCPECRRSTTVSLTVHMDGDAEISCSACDAVAFVHKLNTQDRTYGGVET